MYQRLRHQQTPPHATGKLACVLNRMINQLQPPQQFINPFIVCFTAKHAGCESQYFTRCKKGVESHFLRYHADLSFTPAALCEQITAKQTDRPATGTHGISQYIDQRAFARPIRPQQGIKAALRNIQGDLVQGFITIVIDFSESLDFQCIHERRLRFERQ